MHEDVERNRAMIRSTYAASFAAVEETVEIASRALQSWAARRPTLTQYHHALVAHVGRATHLAHGVVVLCETLAGDSAMMLVRGLFETMRSAYWMSFDPVPRAATFGDYGELEEIEFAHLMRKLGFIGAHELRPEHRDRKRKTELDAAFPKPMLGWTQEDGEKIEREMMRRWPRSAATDLGAFADVVRFVGNRQVHLSATETISRLRRENGRPLLRLGPTQRSELWLSLALKVTAWSYGQLFDLAAEKMKITNLSAWRARFSRAMLRTKVLTPEETKGVKARDRCPCKSGFKYVRCHGERR